ncbi:MULTISPECIES: hypothetical protein [Bacillus]|uniref:hypothetical protein n=1 Tax=Bacillus subtilis TaxID=1423 RepID=UPI00202A0CE1|nr:MULTISPECIES: hypothetical protein [Bacillus]MCX3303315.1 hypothetical protein [Bacillus pacificus]
MRKPTLGRTYPSRPPSPAAARGASRVGNSYPYYQDKKEKDFSLRSNPLKKHKRPHFLMWSFILQLKHPLVQQTKIG